MDSAWLADLGLCLEQKYLRTGNFQHLCDAAAIFSAAVSNTTEDDPFYSDYHDSMERNYEALIEIKSAQQDLVQKFSMSRKILEAHEAVKSLETVEAMWEAAMRDETSPGEEAEASDAVGTNNQTNEPPLWAILNSMSMAYYETYREMAGIEDSDNDSDDEFENQSEEGQAEESNPEENEPEESGSEGGDSEQREQMELLDKAIEASHEAIRGSREAGQTTLDGYPILGAMLTHLGHMLERRYDETGQVEDLDESIQSSRQALQNTPDDHIYFATFLDKLKTRLTCRYERTRQIEDLDELVWVFRQKVQIAPDDSPGPLLNLGGMLTRRYDQTGQEEDLHEAIRLSRQAIKITSDDDPFFAAALGSLSGQLSRLYRFSGQIEDLEESIEISRQAIQATPNDDGNIGTPLNNLGIALGHRYDRTGNMEDLDEAIQVYIQAVELVPDDLPTLTTFFTNLGLNLGRRYEQTGQMEDLEQAIRIFLRAVELTPENDPGFAAVLNNLGINFARLYNRTAVPKFLDEAIRVSRQAIQLTPDNYQNNIGESSNLALLLNNRYERLGRPEDLEEAIQLSRRGFQATPIDHADHARLSTNLGIILRHQYEKSGDKGDLEEASRMSGQAIQGAPDDHPNIIMALYNHGVTLEYQYRETKQIEFLKEATRVAQQAFQITAARPLARSKAAILAANLLLEQGDHQSGYTLSAQAIDLLQLVHTRSVAIQDRQWIVAHFFSLATLGCSFSIQAKQPLFNALRLLENGRGVILSLLMDDRSDTTKLREAYPDLCALYETLRVQVNTPSEGEGPIGQEEGKWRYTKQPKAIGKLEKCIQDIRKLPGFGAFQQGLTKEQIQDTSTEGSIIVVNVSKLRSDAIIVLSTGISSVPLPRFDAAQAQTWIDKKLTQAKPSERGRKNREYRKFLAWLWYECVKPILTRLGYTVQSSPESLPRVWWIGTGIASSFPFHAASDFSAGPTENTFCRVLSSYTISIKALIHSRERAPISSFSDARPRKLLMVTMGNTPGADDLPGAVSEKSTVLKTLGSSVQAKILDQPDSVSVIRQIPECNIAHFACHGVSDWMYPSQSGLLLQTDSPGFETPTDTETPIDTETSPDPESPAQDVLSFEKLCESNPTQGEIAYLSACSTAENNIFPLMDEMLHVVSGFQVAGFRHVIGTLWPSGDEVCVEVAGAFYAELCRSGTLQYTDRDIAIALHKAASALAMSEEYQRRPLHWAQYVHYGA
ncbi:uncharacterized protein N7479_000694 [Penicillium vulpinum]|uniref:CHAT domain-containing protein n=1 Tax=Penicillium vulpinum TaxID=29845 RepID=A0A1V6S7D1_9EURO|nr:uncharacterized protein N7479_000694 [Penicillium vulpinum]KAJ5970776.1 hypothetical protein N7479_000694 [Penicillium vulpinum]OQE09634.1 hypothetical protein PENVUL_c006G07615 [Penicillium vulpinum]